MRLCMVGTGYVGLVSGACFAETGTEVLCVDIDASKIERLSRGEIPIHEPGLEEMVRDNVQAKRLSFSSDVADAVTSSDVVFVAVGTPRRSDGAADLSAVDRVAEMVAAKASREVALVLKSTVPVGTNARVRRIVAEAQHPVHVVSNPEFLKEGDAIRDFMRPDRIVIGCDENDEFARDIMSRLYHPVSLSQDRIIWMDPASAELTKYVSNTMLAMRISFMNEVAALCEKVGADVHQVRKGVGSDERIGAKFLYAGPGYGGSCLHGSETILIREDEVVRLVDIGKLFTEKAPAEADPATAIATAGLEVLAWNPSTKRAEFFGCAALTRRPYEGPLCEVRTKMGRRLRCTPDHPFVTLSLEGVSTGVKLASELTESDWLPLGGSSPRRESAPRTIDLLDHLSTMQIPPSEVIVRMGSEHDALLAMKPTRMAELLAPLTRPDRVYEIRRCGTLRLDEARALGLSLSDAQFGTARNGTYIPRYWTLDERFWRVLGLYLAAGHCTTDGRRRRLYWTLHPTSERELVDEISSYFTDRGIECDVRRGTTAMNVSVSSRLLAGLFLDVLQLGVDCYSHRIPDLVWSADAPHRLALLSGLWNGDGSWSYLAGAPNGGDASVALEYGTVSRALADGMLRLLLDAGIVGRLKVGRPPKATTNTYFLVVSGADQIERALMLIKAHDHGEVLASLSQQRKRIAPTGYRLDAGTYVRVSGLSESFHQGFVYSLEVPDVHTVVTTAGLVVHNCFPKDVTALVHVGREHGVELELAAATDRVNHRQKSVLARKLKQVHFGGDLRGKRICIWGIAFKPRTDDVREAPALQLIDVLLSEGAEVRAHDPEAMANMRALYADRVQLFDDAYEAAEGADALVLVTEWRQYQNPDFGRLRSVMRQPLLLDGRNIWSGYGLRKQGFVYDGIGVRGS